MRVELEPGQSSLDRNVEIFRAETKHARHAREIDRHATVDGVDMTFERAAHSERDDRTPVLRAHLDDCGDFFGRHRKDDGIRKSGRVPRLAMAVVFADGVRRGDAVTEDAAQRFDHDSKS